MRLEAEQDVRAQPVPWRGLGRVSSGFLPFCPNRPNAGLPGTPETAGYYDASR
jgi:hypothetical protein